MVTVLITHEVDDVKHWLESPDRGPAFASVGFTVETFVDPTATQQGRHRPGGSEPGRAPEHARHAVRGGRHEA